MNVLAVECNDASAGDLSAKNQDLQLIRRNGNLAQQRLHAWEIIGGLTREQPPVRDHLDIIESMHEADVTTEVPKLA